MIVEDLEKKNIGRSVIDTIYGNILKKNKKNKKVGIL